MWCVGCPAEESCDAPTPGIFPHAVVAVPHDLPSLPDARRFVARGRSGDARAVRVIGPLALWGKPAGFVVCGYQEGPEDPARYKLLADRAGTRLTLRVICSW
jgi:hypothetical protein